MSLTGQINGLVFLVLLSHLGYEQPNMDLLGCQEACASWLSGLSRDRKE